MSQPSKITHIKLMKNQKKSLRKFRKKKNSMNLEIRKNKISRNKETLDSRKKEEIKR